ncbi:hypothetical protein CEJ45_18200 [Herbaspirillum aquaticum]|jgi:hypothetical protein|uniref:Uncharacterized protein n=1 Tax=Herbaspirillum aquaticum TaxID=568783 RepID=A0A225SQS6_9BURK|nr:hypothetical protein CEJ45_18200 [Herbaspirillum aquaticum]
MMCLRPLSVNVLAEFYDGPSMNKNDLISLINEIGSYIATDCAAKRQKKPCFLRSRANAFSGG